jgi:TatD DNase family protein
LLFDAHVHLTDREYSDYIPQILTSLKAMKIVACSVAVDMETSVRGLELFSGSHDTVKQFVGIHPEFAEKNDPERLSELVRLNRQAVDGIGEIGLDGTYDTERGVPYDRQKQIFHSMLAIAEAEGKPVSIHSRRALDDILEILPSYRLHGVLLHWFAGSKKQLARSMDMELYVSYGPTLVYADDKKVLLKNTRRDKFLVETDGPVRYSRCFENKLALPSSFLISVVLATSQTLRLSYAETVNILNGNAESFLSQQL